MNKAEKTATIEELKEQFGENNYFYLADASTMSVGDVNKFRRLCFEKGVSMQVIKNTLVKKALEDTPAEKNYAGIFEALHGPTAILFSKDPDAPANSVAKMLKDYRRSGSDRPLLKAAYVDSAVFIGDDQLDALTKLKSKQDLLGELIGLLQSPAKNLVSALQSGGSTIAGLVKALEERQA
ncbi:50S ribosomal protein L10 [Haliscomenobacter sp.]|uniref:50S ribosomal protein L10 n=1 Tax=Haliscomenobacter sp. TaxID=2717303 RepID=UPI003BAB2BCF